MAATHKITYNPLTREAQVLPLATANPAGFTKIGEFDSETLKQYPVCLHVRDALYFVKHSTNPPTAGFWPENETDMARITITMPTAPAVIPVDFISPNEATVTVNVGATHQNAIFYNPENATVKTLTVSSSAPGVATAVFDGPLGGGSQATGVTVTGVAAGEATITLTTNNGKTATFTVTVS
ncbi:structural protein with Ig domain [Delftia phage RG-2014]|uniref:Virion decoration protein n=1 Tax=Delftia phage RG-2014 TaxID=1563661 RepID=A0A097PAM4_9CAUD|nr:structural protein with Ig domain [Delftia phage RG-2014]AIU44278.1 virion decoration protein [Delftia phage RG-2014]